MQGPSLVNARRNKRQARDSNTVRSEDQPSVCTCDKCGKIFSEPIELTILTEDSPEIYHACPHCFSRVNVSDNLRKPLSEVVQSTLSKAVKETNKDVKKIKPVGCANFLGFLKTRPEGSPIPDECLICVSVVTCMGL